MSKSSVAEYRNKTADELVGLITGFKKEQFNLRFQKATGELKNTARFTQVRKEIAKIQTVLSEKRNKEGSNA